MLTLITSAAALPLRMDDYHIRQVSTGENELEFAISIYDPMYQQIQEESVIREESGALPAARYLVKAIDGGAEDATIICKLDLDAWKGALTVPYNSGSVTIGALVNSIKPAGWTVINNSGVTIRRTISLEAATPYDVLAAARATFAVTFSFDNLAQKVTIVNPEAGAMRGAFATKELNLKENNYRGKSSAFCTRLYAFGKDGLTFREINGGKPYVENFTYSDKVICGYWKDERYTVAENLLTDARAKLALLAVPERSYDCDVMDLAKLAPEKFSAQAFHMFDIVGLIDESRAGTVIYHRIVEYWIYPNYPEKNKVVLSTSPQKIQSQIRNLTNAIENPNSEWSLSQSATQDAAIENASNLITGNKGGYVVLSLDEDGKPYEILIMDTQDKLTAKKVWRWNQGGLGYSNTGYNGHYGLAMTQDGSIVADFINVGSLTSSNVIVGGFQLSATALKNGMTSFQDTQHNGVYLGTDGIALGAGKFRVDSSGNVSASSLAITGGSINIGDKFRVDSSGNLSATSGTFSGNVYAGNIRSSAVDGYGGSFSGYGLTGGTVTGGYGGAIGGGTITTANTSGGINTSLANGDAAYRSINNYGYAYIGMLVVRDGLVVAGRRGHWQQIITEQQGAITVFASD